MNIQNLRLQTNSRFHTVEQRGIANKAIDFLEEWVELTQFSSENISPAEKPAKKKECAQYIKDRLYQSRQEQEVGFIGTFISAILFQLIVSLVVKFIIDRFFS